VKQVPRKKAIQALAQVLADKRYLDQVLEPLMGPVEFENAWLKDVVTGTLRWKGRIDYFIDEFAHKKKPSGKLRRALLIAGYQILEHTEVHPIQVIDETVEWIKQEEGKPPSGFANVLLRKFYEHRQAILELDCDERASLSHKRAVTSLPDWILLPLEKKIGWEKNKEMGS
jgi:16S rRNA (cytosine967-C5)-methyltransferase